MRGWIALGVALLLTACASGPRNLPRVPFVVSPTAVVTADIAQNRLAQEDGVIDALKDTAADGALLFAPGPVDADEWLNAQPSFPPTSWSAHKVILSCDGKTGVTTGAIRWGETDGYYTTIWRYFPKGRDKGEWRWVLSHGDGVASPRVEPDFVESRVASCEGQPSRAGATTPIGFSDDGSLRYVWSFDPAEGRTLNVALWDGEGYATAIEDTVPAN